MTVASSGGFTASAVNKLVAVMAIVLGVCRVTTGVTSLVAWYADALLLESRSAALFWKRGPNVGSGKGCVL